MKEETNWKWLDGYIYGIKLLECENASWCPAFEMGCWKNCSTYSYKNLIKPQKKPEIETISEGTYKSLFKLHEKIRQNNVDKWFWSEW